MANENSFQMTLPAPVVWANVVEPRKANSKLQNKEPRYEVTFLFPTGHVDLSPIKKLLASVAKERFGFFTGKKFPIEDGSNAADEAAAKNRDREFLRGRVILRAHANVTKRDGTLLSPPRLVVLKDGKYVRFSDDERPLAKKFFYSGVQAIGSFTFVAYEGMGGGVSAYLNEILSLGTGTPIVTGIDDETKYGPATQYIGRVSDINPMEDPEELPF